MTQTTPDVSIILCTRDRAQDLSKTLASLGSVLVPQAMRVELVVVDNGSRDATSEVVHRFRSGQLAVRYVHEARPGKGNAYNAGIAATQSRALLFSDDDVRFPSNWIEGMCAPILRTEWDALAGGVRIAKSLDRDWMIDTHRLWMADTASLSSSSFEMIGANMAFGRHVLEKVPGFDPELGPGASGLGEDTLFHWQLVQAGFRVKLRQEVAVEHHFDPSRLTRGAFLKRAESMGRSLAYLDHHWEHKTIPLVSLRLVKSWARLKSYRALRRALPGPDTEGADIAELVRVSGFNYYRQYLRERARPRNYERHGLVKLGS